VWLETLSVSIAVAAWFGLLGVTTVDAELTRDWTGQASAQVLQLIRILGEELVVSAALLQVAGFLGALAAPVFAIEVLVDEQSRYEIIGDLLAGYTQAVRVWAADEAGSAGEPTAAQNP
jgi:ABC-type microcin C transport system permease subunit YejB